MIVELYAGHPPRAVLRPDKTAGLLDLVFGDQFEGVFFLVVARQLKIVIDLPDAENAGFFALINDATTADSRGHLNADRLAEHGHAFLATEILVKINALGQVGPPAGAKE